MDYCRRREDKLKQEECQISWQVVNIVNQKNKSYSLQWQWCIILPKVGLMPEWWILVRQVNMLHNQWQGHWQLCSGVGEVFQCALVSLQSKNDKRIQVPFIFSRRIQCSETKMLLVPSIFRTDLLLVFFWAFIRNPLESHGHIRKIMIHDSWTNF